MLVLGGGTVSYERGTPVILHKWRLFSPEAGPSRDGPRMWWHQAGLSCTTQGRAPPMLVELNKIDEEAPFSRFSSPHKCLENISRSQR